MIKIKNEEAAELLAKIANLESQFQSDWTSMQEYPLFRLRDIRRHLEALLKVENGRPPNVCYHCGKPEAEGTYHVAKQECNVVERKWPTGTTR